eukprot:4238967-Prymnesium_polylepis.1
MALRTRAWLVAARLAIAYTSCARSLESSWRRAPCRRSSASRRERAASPPHSCRAHGGVARRGLRAVLECHAAHRWRALPRACRVPPGRVGAHSHPTR